MTAQIFVKNIRLESLYIRCVGRNFDCPKIPKYVNFIDLFRYSNQFSHKLQIWHLSPCFQSTAQTFYTISPLGNHYYCSIGWNFDSPKIPMNVNQFDLSRSSNTNFSLATGFLVWSFRSTAQDFYKNRCLQKRYFCYFSSVRSIFDSPKFINY